MERFNILSNPTNSKRREKTITIEKEARNDNRVIYKESLTQKERSAESIGAEGQLRSEDKD